MSRENDVVFASYRCNCTILGRTFAEIPKRCPEHNMEMLDRPSWEVNENNVPLGISKSEKVAEEIMEPAKQAIKGKDSWPNLLDW